MQRVMSTQKLPMVGRVPAGEAPDHGDGHGDADGGAHELLRP